jgi:hypothetical protein
MERSFSRYHTLWTKFGSVTDPLFQFLRVILCKKVSWGTTPCGTKFGRVTDPLFQFLRVLKLCSRYYTLLKKVYRGYGPINGPSVTISRGHILCKTQFLEVLHPAVQSLAGGLQTHYYNSPGSKTLWNTSPWDTRQCEERNFRPIITFHLSLILCGTKFLELPDPAEQSLTGFQTH